MNYRVNKAELVLHHTDKESRNYPKSFRNCQSYW